MRIVTGCRAAGSSAGDAAPVAAGDAPSAPAASAMRTTARDARPPLGPGSRRPVFMARDPSGVPEPVEAVEDQVEPEQVLGGVVVARLGDVAPDHLDYVRI